MKTLAEINHLLSVFHEKHGIDLRGADQGSDTWLRARLGIMTGSSASKIVSKGETRETYMSELVAQVCTGIVAEEIQAKALAWGKEHEDAARSSYEFATGELVEEVPFIFLDDSFREGFSPDGLLTTPKGLELKCPWNSVHYVKFVTDETIKPEYKWQMQYGMRVTGALEWDFGMFDPRMKVKPLHYIPVERDEKMQKTLEDACGQFIKDVDAMLEKLGVEFGSQWQRLKAQGAA